MSRAGGSKNQFDVSDHAESLGAEPLGGETLESVLEVASSVIQDYARDDGATRIERMARFIAGVLGGEPYLPHLRSDTMDVFAAAGNDLLVYRDDDRVRFNFTGALTPDEARSAAVALIRAAELADAAA